MKPVSLPMLYLLGRGHGGDGRTRYVGLAAATHSEHSLVLVGEDFDKSGESFRPVVENPRGARADSESEMAGDELPDKLCFSKPSLGGLRIFRSESRRFENWLEVDRFQNSELFGEVSALGKNV